MEQLIWTLQSLDLYAILDISLIAFLLFGLSFLFRGTQAVPVLRGTLLVIIFIILLSAIPNLVAFRWLSQSVITGAAIAVPIIFQPELRRAMERLGRAGFAFRQPRLAASEVVVEHIVNTVLRLSERRHGALLVLEKNDPLNEFIETGVYLDGAISPQTLLTIFFPKTELHDGAVIIRGDRIVCAAAVLPLTAAHGLAQRKVGTRHRAAIGMTEISDALVVVVSEETGQISVATSGQLIRRLDTTRLTTILTNFYTENSPLPSLNPLWELISSWLPKTKADLVSPELNRETTP